MSLLDHLVGSWTLRGRMGDKALYQEALGRWVLGGLSIELRFSAVDVGRDGNPPYEAIYLMAYDKKRDEYVLHLFDTSGVTSQHVPGVGKRDGNSIRFQFPYPTGNWFNTFTWHPEHQAWTSIITYQQDGEERTFAKKELTLTQ